MAASDAVIQIRLPQEEKDAIEEQSTLEGFTSVTSYMRHLARVERLKASPTGTHHGGRLPRGGYWDAEEIEVARRKDRDGHYVLTVQQVSLALSRKQSQVYRIRRMTAEQAAEEAAWALAQNDLIIEKRLEQDRQWRAAQIRAAGEMAAHR